MLDKKPGRLAWYSVTQHDRVQGDAQRTLPPICAARWPLAVTGFRRHWPALLAARPEGFPWLKVAGRELSGVTVVDLDATIVFAASGKDNAVATYKRGGHL